MCVLKTPRSTTGPGAAVTYVCGFFEMKLLKKNSVSLKLLLENREPAFVLETIEGLRSIDTISSKEL